MTNPSHVLKLAVAQFAISGDRGRNIQRAEQLARQAARQGAQVALLPELFESLYFPREKNVQNLGLARSVAQSEAIAAMSALASELKVVIPVSFFEKDGDSFYNSVAVIDADGTNLGLYRKSHIPDGEGYQEKFYFQPGNTGFRVFDTRYGRIGVGICWDQWFFECARAMTLLGAQVLLFPTAIGSEPEHPELDTRESWRRVMVGHAVGNAVPIAAANRIGEEAGLSFYGSSFIADHKGELRAELGRQEEGVAMAALDLDEARRYQKWLGVLSDRRPDLYGILTRKQRS